MGGRVLASIKLQAAAYLLLLMALLASSWSPVLLLIVVALVAEWNQRGAQSPSQETRT